MCAGPEGGGAEFFREWEARSWSAWEGEVGDWGCRVWVRRHVGQICVLEGSLWLERRGQDQGGGCGEGEAGMGLGTIRG